MVGLYANCGVDNFAVDKVVGYNLRIALPVPEKRTAHIEPFRIEYSAIVGTNCKSHCRIYPSAVRRVVKNPESRFRSDNSTAICTNIYRIPSENPVVCAGIEIGLVR